MPYGYRAAFKVLQNYYSLHKCLTLSQYIARWAPSNENNTNIVAAMSKVENGRQANIKDVEEGYRLAFEII